MSVFESEEQIYQVMQALFDSMKEGDPDPVRTMASSRLTFRVSLTDPTAHITINSRKRPVSIDYGAPNMRADLEIGMSAQTLHLILLDQYSIKQGFSNGELKVRGPIWKALSFADIFKQGRTFYPKVLQEQGLA
jgi:hypothetical protein